MLLAMGWCFGEKYKLQKMDAHLLLGFKVEGSITFKHICALEDWLEYYTLMNYCMPSNGHNNSHNQMHPHQN